MIEYRYNVDGLTTEELSDGFFKDWPNPPSKKTHLMMLKKAYRMVLAMDTDTSKVIGFINAISDGILSAYIPLLEVIEVYKNKGIGSELVRRMLVELDGIYMIDIVCDKNVQPFYEKFSMVKADAMVLRNYENQCGLGFDDG